MSERILPASLREVQDAPRDKTATPNPDRTQAAKLVALAAERRFATASHAAGTDCVVLPLTLNVSAGVDYSVHVSRGPILDDSGGECIGICSFDTRRIDLLGDGSVGIPTLLVTLAHEYAHAVLNATAHQRSKFTVEYGLEQNVELAAFLMDSWRHHCAQHDFYSLLSHAVADITGAGGAF